MHFSKDQPAGGGVILRLLKGPGPCSKGMLTFDPRFKQHLRSRGRIIGGSTSVLARGGIEPLVSDLHTHTVAIAVAIILGISVPFLESYVGAWASTAPFSI